MGAARLMVELEAYGAKSDWVGRILVLMERNHPFMSKSCGRRGVNEATLLCTLHTCLDRLLTRTEWRLVAFQKGPSEASYQSPAHDPRMRPFESSRARRKLRVLW